MHKLVFALLLSVVAVDSVEAQYARLTQRSQVGGSSFIDWTPSDAALPASFSVAVANSPLTAIISQTDGNDFLLMQAASEWSIPETYPVLWALGSITMTLSGPVSAFGAGLQPFGASSIRISALDAVGNVLNAFDIGAADIADGERSLFVGMSSSLGNISRVRWELLSGGTFGMNRISLNTATVVPEPMSSSLIISGLAALALVARRRRTR